MTNAAVPSALVLALAAAVLGAQGGEVLYYKFDEAGGLRAANFAPAASPAPEEGTIVTNDTGAFTPGRFVSALRGGSGALSTYVETGWNGAFTGDFTVALFVLQRNAPTAAASHLFGNNVSPGFRAFTSGAAGRGVRVGDWGGTPGNLDLTRDVQTLATAGWVHLALVVDTGRATATWYVDGVAEPAIPIGSGANAPASPGFRVGAQGLPSSTWDIDEFRLLTRAASPLEVRAWARQTSGADSPFGRGCGAALAGTSGAPAFGNANYAIKIGAAPSQPYILALGFSRTNWLSLPLPFPLGVFVPALQGCDWYTDVTFTILSATDPGGGDAILLPIPNDPTLEGLALYAQALVLRTGAEQSSNAVAISLGH